VSSKATTWDISRECVSYSNLSVGRTYNILFVGAKMPLVYSGIYT